MSLETYPEKYERLKSLVSELQKETPGTINGFNQLHQKSTANGALSKKTKELMALGMAITAHCDGCIAYHVHDSIKAGASREEIMEAIGVAIMMGGGPALMYACEALEAVNQYRDSTVEQQQLDNQPSP